MSKLIGTTPKAAEDTTGALDWLKRNDPDGDYEGLSPAMIHNMVTSLSAQKRRERAAPKGKLGVDRSKIDYGRYPELEGIADTMTDSDISKFIAERLGQGDGSQPQYEDVKGAPKLKIVQDAAFERSGLKSGDTVCIRIP